MLARSISNGVSHHTMAWLTRDVHEATVFRQSWEHIDTGARTEFWVLAFREDAETHGANRLAVMPGATPEVLARMRLVSNEADIHASNDVKRSIVETEDSYEAATRARRWRQMEDGGDVELDGHSATDAIQRAYDALAALRKA